MLDFQEDKLSMYLATRKVLDKFSTVWSVLAAFVTGVAAFDAVIAAIQGDDQVQQTDFTGVTQDKQEAKDDAIEKTLEVAGGTEAYASATDNSTLREKVNSPKSDYTRARDTVLIDLMQLVHDEADGVIGSLGSYGITAGDLTDLQDLIDAYADQVQAPREAISTRAAATQELPELFAEGDKILDEQLDTLMLQFKTSNEKFYSTYLNARKIVDSGSRSTVVTGMVTDTDTEAPIEGVLVELADAEKSGLTDADGVYRIEEVGTTEDDITFSKEGWEDLTLPAVEILRGKVNTYDAELSMIPPAPAPPPSS